MKFILSEESVNKKKIKILTSGMLLDNFKANPVLLYNHNDSEVIGRWINIAVEGDKLVAEPEFDTDDELAMKVQAKCEKGLINGASIGIEVLEYEFDEEEGYTIFTKTQPFEASITAVPANENTRKFRYKGEELKFKTSKELCFSLKSIDEKLNTEIMEKPIETVVAQEIQIDPTLILKSEIVELRNQVENLMAEKMTFSTKIDTFTQDNQTLIIEKNKLGEELNTLNKKFMSLSKERQTDKINMFLQEAKRLGQINYDESKEYFKLAQLDFDGVKKLISQRPKKNPNPFTEKLKFGLEDRSRWTFHDWSKKDGKGLMDMKDDNPSEYYRLYNSI